MHIYLFDIDGTLIDTQGAGRDAMIVALAKEFNTHSDFENVVFAGRTDRAIVSDLFQLHSIVDNDTNWNRFCMTFTEHLPEHLKRRNGRVLPGIVPLLDRLAARSDVVLGLLTGNLREGARWKLSHYGLYDYFTSVNGAIGAFGDIHRDRDDVARDALAAEWSPPRRQRPIGLGNRRHPQRCPLRPRDRGGGGGRGHRRAFVAGAAGDQPGFTTLGPFRPVAAPGRIGRLM